MSRDEGRDPFLKRIVAESQGDAIAEIEGQLNWLYEHGHPEFRASIDDLEARGISRRSMARRMLKNYREAARALRSGK